MEKYIKSKMDLEAASTLLTKVMENVHESVKRYENRKDFFGEIMYKKESDRFSVFCQCKDNLDFVIGVLKSYIDNHQDPSMPKVICYSPRKFTYIYDVGKFQTEVLKAKRNIETLLWIAKISKGEEIELYQECIKRLNYVYSHIAKNK